MNQREMVPGGIELIPQGGDKDRRSRLGMFAAWLQETGRSRRDPDLAAYRDHLLGRLKPSSAAAHLSTIRGRYKDLLADNRTRDHLYSLASQQTKNPVLRKAVVDEVVIRVRNAIEPRNAPLRIETTQDSPDSLHTRLTAAQAASLMAAPGTVTLKGIRDTAIISLMLCSGIREAELVGLDVGDLRQPLGGELALHVRRGKGMKIRLVPYGDLDGVLVLADAWMARAGIESGAVFRPLWKSHRMRGGRLTTRAIQRLLKGYEIVVDGELMNVRPHDLRRTYARRCFDSGMGLAAIAANLGHSSLETTLGYIGPLDVQRRRPPAMYQFPRLA